MITMTRQQIEELASRNEAHARRAASGLPLYASELNDFRLAAAVLRAVLALGVPVGTITVAESGKPSDKGEGQS